MTQTKRIPIEQIVEHLAGLRRASGMTMTEVALRMQTSKSVVHYLERGEKDPGLTTLQRYARAIGHPIVDIEVIPDEEDDAELERDEEIRAALWEEAVTNGDSWATGDEG